MELSRERRKLIEWCDLSVLSRDNEPHKDSECMSIRWGGTTHGLDPHKDPLSVSVSDGLDPGRLRFWPHMHSQL